MIPKPIGTVRTEHLTFQKVIALIEKHALEQDNFVEEEDNWLRKRRKRN